MWFFDDALSAPKSIDTTVDAASTPNEGDISASLQTLMDSTSAQASSLIVEEEPAKPLEMISQQDAGASDGEITFFGADAASGEAVQIAAEDTTEQTNASTDVAVMNDEPNTSDAFFSDTTASSEVAVVSPEGDSEEAVVTDEAVNTASDTVLDQDDASQDSEVRTVVSEQSDDLPADPAQILSDTVKALEKSEEALKEQAQKLEDQAQSYHEQAEALSQAEQDAKKQAEKLHKKADELDVTIKEIATQQEKFSKAA